MAKETNRYSNEFRDEAVGRVRAGAKVRVVSREMKVPRTVLYDWVRRSKNRVQLRYESPDERKDREIRELRGQVQGLQSKIGEQAMDLDFFRAALRRVGAPVPARGNVGNSRSAKRSAAALNRKAE